MNNISCNNIMADDDTLTPTLEIIENPVVTPPPKDKLDIIMDRLEQIESKYSMPLAKRPKTEKQLVAMAKGRATAQANAKIKREAKKNIKIKEQKLVQEEVKKIISNKDKDDVSDVKDNNTSDDTKPRDRSQVDNSEHNDDIERANIITTRQPVHRQGSGEGGSSYQSVLQSYNFGARATKKKK